MLRYGVLALLLLILLRIGVGQLSAHGALVRSDPPDNTGLSSPPREVHVWFDEAIIPGTGQLTVINSLGERVDLGDTHHVGPGFRELAVSLRPNLPDDTYIISGEGLVFTDGHTARGSTVFWVGAHEHLSSTASRPSAPLALLAALLSAWLGIAGLGYWWIYHRQPPLEVQPPSSPDRQGFPLD